MLKLEELKLTLLLAGFRYVYYPPTELTTTNAIHAWSTKCMQIQIRGELLVAQVNVQGHPIYEFHTNKGIIDLLGVLKYVNQIG